MADEQPPTVRRYRLTFEGWLWAFFAGVLLAAGLVKTINLLILLGYLMLALLGLNAYLGWRAAARVTARRVPAAPTFAGRPLVRTFVVANRADKGASVGVLETSRAHAADVFVPALRPGEERWAEARLPAAARGRYDTSPLWVVAGYPFGLVSHVVAAAPAEVLTILPAVGHVDTGALRRWLVRTGAGDSRTRRVVRRPSPNQADVRGVRAYRPGDSPRDIHWRTSARRNELVVREYDSTEPLDLLLVLDPWRPAGRGAWEPDPQLEAAVSLAASVFWAWCLSDDSPHAAVVVAGPTGGWRSGRATPGFGREALGLLAGVTGGPAGGSGAIPADPLRRRSNRSARILVSSRPNSPLADELRRVAGVPFVVADPTTPLAWYTPPKEG